MTVSDYNDAKMFYIYSIVVNAAESKTKESLFEDTGAKEEQVIYEHVFFYFSYDLFLNINLFIVSIYYLVLNWVASFAFIFFVSYNYY